VEVVVVVMTLVVVVVVVVFYLTLRIPCSPAPTTLALEQAEPGQQQTTRQGQLVATQLSIRLSHMAAAVVDQSTKTLEAVEHQGRTVEVEGGLLVTRLRHTAVRWWLDRVSVVAVVIRQTMLAVVEAVRVVLVVTQTRLLRAQVERVLRGITEAPSRWVVEEVEETMAEQGWVLSHRAEDWAEIRRLRMAGTALSILVVVVVVVVVVLILLMVVVSEAPGGPVSSLSDFRTRRWALRMPSVAEVAQAVRRLRPRVGVAVVDPRPATRVPREARDSGAVLMSRHPTRAVVAVWVARAVWAAMRPRA
jgi:hypothetical protein